MEDWKSDPNKRSLAIIRRSSAGQKHNTSSETQECEIREYCTRWGLDLVKLEPIIETAYKSNERKKYQELLNFALQNGIRNILFYISSREARNLTDNEKNEELIRSDRVVIHHVKEGKVFHKNSPDSEFLMRDINASINKHYSRENSSKMKAAYKTKAENGWWPYRHTPLGYVHQKEKDNYGNPIKGTAKLVPDPNHRNVEQVRREFELRARGLSYDQIRTQIIREGYLSKEDLKTYHRGTLTKRLKNPLYWGYFYLNGSPLKYQGAHALIIPENILDKVARINKGQGKRSSRPIEEQGIFSDGWIKCGNSDCSLSIVYDPKTKRIKKTGEIKTYRYYRCSNQRKVHSNHVYLNEEKILGQFEPAMEDFEITKEFADELRKAIKETFEKEKQATQKQMEGFRLARESLRDERRRAYQFLAKRTIDEKTYQEQMDYIDHEEDRYTDQLEALQLQIKEEGQKSVERVFELAINAKSIWKKASTEEQVATLKKVCSNPVLEGLTLRYQLQKPFELLARMKKDSK